MDSGWGTIQAELTLSRHNMITGVDIEASGLISTTSKEEFLTYCSELWDLFNAKTN